MYALYSKGFAKKAQDLNKKEFNGGKCQYQLITKATTGDKTAFESNVDNGGADKFVKFTVPVDNNFKVGVKALANKDTEVDAEFKFDDNLTLRGTVKNLDPTFVDQSMRITAGADYVTEAFSVESALCLYDMQKGKATAKSFLGLLPSGSGGNTGGSVAVTANCPGLDWLRVGFQGGVSVRGDAGLDLNTNVAFAHATKEYELAAQLGVGNLLNSRSLAGGSLRGWFNASDKLKIAAEVDVVGKCALAKDMYATPGDETNTTKPEDLAKLGLGSSKLQVGTEYKLNGSTTLKGKLTANHDGKAAGPVAVDVAVITALEGKSSGTFTLQNKGDGKATAFGFSYTLEA